MDTQHGEMFGKDGMCEKGCHRHMAVRALSAIIVAIFIFWCGFQFGEIRASIGGDYGFGARMMQNGWSGHGGVYQPMMVGSVPSDATVQTTSATSGK